jgi:hypothetical protein
LVLTNEAVFFNSSTSEVEAILVIHLTKQRHIVGKKNKFIITLSFSFPFLLFLVFFPVFLPNTSDPTAAP